MNFFSKSSLLLAAGLLAFSSAAKAQLQTYNTQPIYGGSVITFTSLNPTLGQTFTGVAAVRSMTYNFFVGSGEFSAETTLNAVFGQWNAGTSSFVGGTTVSFGNVVIPASNTQAWFSIVGDGSPNGPFLTYEHLFDLGSLDTSLTNAVTGYETNPTLTYALMLTLQGSPTGLGLGETTSGNVFTFGQAYRGNGDYFRDWTFSQITVLPPEDLTPIPESSTVAALAASGLVAALVGFRLRQRRQAAQAATPASA